MTNSNPNPIDDPVSEQAADWYLRQKESPLSTEEHQAFERWLAQSPEHRQAYHEMEHIWQATGLLPPATRPIAKSSFSSFITRHRSSLVLLALALLLAVYLSN